MIKLTLDIEPVAKERPRIGKWGGYTPAKTAGFERAVAALVKSEMGPKPPMIGALRLSARFIFAPPKRKTRPYPCKGDLDNYEKALCDALNKVLWKDDVQITEKQSLKLYDMSGGKSRIEIEVEEL